MTESNPEDQSQIENVPINDLIPGRVQTELSDDEQLIIRFIHEMASQHVMPGRTLEQTELDFMRELDPGKEIAVWCGIVCASHEYCERHPDCPIQDSVLAALRLSMGVPSEIATVNDLEMIDLRNSLTGDELHQWLEQWQGGDL